MNKLLRDKKKRPLGVLLIILPLLIVIGIFGFLLYKGFAGTDPAVVEDRFNIESMDYHLRSNATDYQKDLFKQLKDAIEKPEEGIQDDTLIAELVVKNFVADFYTWTNKQGQFDIGGMYYVYSPHKKNTYNYARFSFYYYLSNYISKYGAENLLEVTSTEAVTEKLAESLEIDGVKYDTYRVKCSWTYVPETSLNLSQFDTECVFEVIKNQDGRFEIARAYE